MTSLKFNSNRLFWICLQRDLLDIIFEIKNWTGFVPFLEQKIQGLFKDFEGPISHFSRIPFSKKEIPESMSFPVLPQISNFILKVFLCLLLSGTWESGLDKVIATKFNDFPVLTSIFNDFQSLEFLFKNSRTVEEHANPDWNTKI